MKWHNVSFRSRVRDVERCAGKPHAPFIEGLASQEVGLLYPHAVSLAKVESIAIRMPATEHIQTPREIRDFRQL